MTTVRPADPVMKSLLHARGRLESKVASGASLAGDDLVDVYDDIVLAVETLANRDHDLEAQIRDLDARKLNRNSTAAKAIWLFAGTVLSVIGSFTLWLVTAS
jgi:hypothetical protein